MRDATSRELAAHASALQSYWREKLKPEHALSVDVLALHRGETYRKALLREHWRLRGEK